MSTKKKYLVHEMLASAANQGTFLNLRAEEGWRLISAIQNGKNTYFYLERDVVIKTKQSVHRGGGSGTEL